MTDLTDVTFLLAVLGSALMGGVFFTFSNFVMRALGRIDKDQGIAAMQAINVTVLNPVFFLVFFGTGVLCGVAAYLSFESASGPDQTLGLLGAGLYLLGCLLVTVVRNVPLNDRLASLDIFERQAKEVWVDYLSRWTFWNHIRTISCILAATLFGASLLG